MSIDKKKRRRDEDYKIADVMSKEVNSYVTVSSLFFLVNVCFPAASHIVLL